MRAEWPQISDQISERCLNVQVVNACSVYLNRCSVYWQGTVPGAYQNPHHTDSGQSIIFLELYQKSNSFLEPVFPSFSRW